MTKEGLSPDYPKWMYKQGARDIMARDAAEEESLRAKGYGHEYVHQAPPVAPGAAVAPAAEPGMVSTSVMDSMLENQKARFDGAWGDKCKEVDGLTLQLKDAVESNQQLAIAHAALSAQHETLKGENQTLIAEHAAIIARVAETSKDTPVAVEPQAAITPSADGAPAESRGPLKAPIAKKV